MAPRNGEKVRARLKRRAKAYHCYTTCGKLERGFVKMVTKTTGCDTKASYADVSKRDQKGTRSNKREKGGTP